MPRYFFDIDDGEHRTTDDEGAVMTGTEAARKEAISVLPDIARDVLPDGDRRVFASSVRDEAGRIIFRATLSLVAEWIR